MEWQFHAADAAEALSFRRDFVDFLRACCTDDSDCDGAEIVFGELVTNVMRHAPGAIQITLQSDVHGLVMLDVCDTGDAFAIAPALPATLFSASGRGLYIVSQLCPYLSSTRTANGNRVSAILPVMAEAVPAYPARELHDGHRSRRAQ